MKARYESLDVLKFVSPVVATKNRWDRFLDTPILWDHVVDLAEICDTCTLGFSIGVLVLSGSAPMHQEIEISQRFF